MRYNGPVPPQWIGRYEVLRPLGAGRFASVYLARDGDTDAIVAIKVLDVDWSQDAQVRRRFVEAAELTRRCDNDRIVAVRAIEQPEDDRPYFVMEYADRGTLAERIEARLREGQNFEVREALHVAEELAECLIVVHDCGVVHRDLKPSNIMFKSVLGDGRERMLVADFGLAPPESADYASPEQADPKRSANVDARTDVYAAGVILYQLLAGRPPFSYADLSQAAAHANGPPDLDVVRPDVPAPLARAVRTAMTPNPLGRYANGRAWREALRRVAASTGMPPTPQETPVPDDLADTDDLTETEDLTETADVSELADLTDFTGLTGLTGLAGWPGASEPPWTDDEFEGRSNRRWLAVVAALVVAAVVVLVIVVVRHQPGSKPSTTAPTTAIPTGSPAVTGWFAAASGPGCAGATPSEAPPGATAAVICTVGVLNVVYCRMASAGAAGTYLSTLGNTEPDAVLRDWSAPGGMTGQAVDFSSDHGPALAWTYTAKPYLGIAEGGARDTLDAWWLTGRAVRHGAR